MKDFVEIVLSIEDQQARSKEWYGNANYSDEDRKSANLKHVKNNGFELGLAKSLFNDFYDKFKADGTPSFEFLIKNFLPDFVEGVAEEWGYSVDVGMSCTATINGSTPILNFYDSTYQLFVLATNGNVYTAKIDHEYTGAIVWDGDERYSKEFREIYTDVSHFGEIENFKRLHDKELTAEKLEAIACELVSLICQ